MKLTEELSDNFVLQCEAKIKLAGGKVSPDGEITYKGNDSDIESAIDFLVEDWGYKFLTKKEVVKLSILQLGLTIFFLACFFFFMIIPVWWIKIIFSTFFGILVFRNIEKLEKLNNL